MSYVYKNGLKFDSTLAKNIDGTLARVKSKKASCLGVDGYVGEGKTTLAVEIAQYIESKYNSTFDIQEQIGMGGKGFLKSMDYAVSNKKHVVIYDEAGDFNTRASLTYFNQQLNRVFETFRATKIVIILCLPSFADIDTSLMKKGVLRFLVHCYGRTLTYGRYSVYDLSRMWYIKSKFAKVTVPADAFRLTTPNFYGQFKDLDPESSNELEKFSIRGKKDIIRKSMLAQRGLVDVKTISKEAGYSVESVRKWVQKSKPKNERYGNTKYYDKSTVRYFLASKGIRNFSTD